MAKSKDPITLAKDFFDEFLTKADPESAKDTPPVERNAQHKAAGRLGGIKGGKARAKKLPPSKRKAIAKKAARGRWG